MNGYLMIKYEPKNQMENRVMGKAGGQGSAPESIEWCIEHQAVSPAYDLVPHPLRPYLSRQVSSTGDTQEGEEPNHATVRKLGPKSFNILSHRLNMKVDLQSLFGHHVTWCAHCTAVLIVWDPATPPSPRIWTRITRALLVSQDRRHLFVTTCSLSTLSLVTTAVALPLWSPFSLYRPYYMYYNM
jgi:hypothetical protein